jgi:hypothetical protein
MGGGGEPTVITMVPMLLLIPLSSDATYGKLSLAENPGFGVYV